MAKRKTTLTTRTHDDYRIGIVCALDFEQVAVLSMLDETHDDLRRIHGDGNRYRLGSLSGHNVVIACLPAGLIGTTQASHLVSDMGRSFSKLRFVLMVGIGGGVPSQTRDMRLGDIAVSVPSGKHPGLVEWDRGKLESHGFNRTGSLNIPPLELLHSVQALRGTHMTGDNRLDQHIERAAVQHQSLKETLFSFPGYQWDRLYEADYSHGNATTCAQCDVSRTIPRVDRGGRTPQIFYGNIGSGDEVIKEGLQRDAIAKDSDIICFEMEAAGIAGILPYLVIRGICDYADSHKHKLWQPWAAVTAAAFAKELLRFVESDVEGLDSSTTRIRSTSVALPVISVTGPATIGIGGPATGGNHDRKGHAARHEITAVGARSASPKRSRDEAEQEDTDDGDSSSIGHSYDEMSSLSERKKACLDSLSFPGMKLRESDINRKIPRTCNWLLENDTYKTWESEAGCLWLKGKPGAGKSTMMKFIVDTMRRQRRKRTIIISHFFDARRPGLQKTRAGLLRALLYQLLIRAEDLLLDFLDRCLERRIDENCDLEDLVWHENILESELELIIQNASTTYSVIILVDALDECRGDVITTRSISVYLNDLCSITEDSEHPLAVIVACRPWPEVMSGYDHIITVDECNIEDVRTAISHRLKGQELPQREVASIQRRIEERASGVIQWVLLVAARVVESTMNGADEETMIKVIDEAPQELYEIYGQLLATLSDDEAEKTRHIMQWVCHARTPLSLDDLRVALVMDTDHLASTAEGTVLLHEGCRSAEKMGKRVKLLSRGLLETKSKDGRRHVQFMHHSVREYMIAHGLKILDKGATVSTDSLIDWTAAPSAECRLALACIRYLNIDETVGSIQPPEDSRRTLQQRGFLRYAVMHWMTHVNIAAHSEEEMASIIDGLETWTSLTIASWIAYYETVCVDADLPSNFVAGMNLLNIAVEANLSHVARVILSRGRASGRSSSLTRFTRLTLWQTWSRAHISRCVVASATSQWSLPPSIRLHTLDAQKFCA
ncbi:hypothetical protein BDZ85DRAFT_53212 [Elsinoe ampelina]|uniref:Nephrocystin 3-like N-terminal domain-containing protein n=1 Tax=Elsinoe ampelina TaxID=302913 RepID=A0A6A6GLZ3_9PEZI|nr:hypothetical protein BDZ85DRAFT_53212 [Elsinoe ampelina]